MASLTSSRRASGGMAIKLAGEIMRLVLVGNGVALGWRRHGLAPTASSNLNTDVAGVYGGAGAGALCACVVERAGNGAAQRKGRLVKALWPAGRADRQCRRERDGYGHRWRY